MPEYIISGIPVNFPFEPYDVQKAYMEKVIMCLEDCSNSVLESPTGTGKTLSLLCSSLAWLLCRKAALQEQVKKNSVTMKINSTPDDITANVIAAGKSNSWGIPKIIYASRTHSQLIQAMQELKRTSYSFMRAVVLGSRDQLCIHPEVMREQGNSSKTLMCQTRVKTRSCSFHMRVESKKDHPDFRGPTIMDIEDLIKVGQKLKMCPYYSSKELVADADITFMPYNYLLDPKARKANKIELNNAIVILDEAHNIEKICEESASVMIRSSDVAMAIDDVTHIMKNFDNVDSQDNGDEPKDFTLEDLALIKEMLLDLEKAIDDIVVDNKIEGVTFPASFIFELLGKANFHHGNVNVIIGLCDKLIQFLSMENTAFRKGGSFQMLSDLLSVVFVNKDDLMPKVQRSFKVHVQIEETKKQNPRDGVKKDGWHSKATTTGSTKAAKIINYWCFNPGFGMEQLLNTQVRSIILTSGTLAPLKPLIAELSIPIKHQLENPHIVDSSQVYVKIIGSGPDRQQLISNYANRDNPKYISSLGQTILNVARIVPDGLLIFFPSYPLLHQCANSWQASGLWSDLIKFKPIFMEPRSKDSFNSTMEEFYQSIRDNKGACFMAVCRGKVSEGLDFADRNGRAVIITGLPYPPLKDPKVILKKRYLEDNRTKENELLTGQAWYSLEATRAVNQAIGRVIRHRHDYGAILLCDYRFQDTAQVQQLSKWVRGHLGATPKSSTFGPVVRELREFFKNAEKTVPKPKERAIDVLESTNSEEPAVVRSNYFADPKQILESKNKFRQAQSQAIKIEKANTIESWSPADYTAAAGRPGSCKAPSALDFMSRLDSNVSSIDFNNCSTNEDLVKIHKRSRTSPTIPSMDAKITPTQSISPNSRSELNKKKRFKLVENNCFNSSGSCTSQSQPTVQVQKLAPEGRVEFLRILRCSLTKDNFTAFTKALVSYKQDDTIEALLELLLNFLGEPNLHYMLLGMRRFLKNEHKSLFDQRVASVISS